MRILVFGRDGQVARAIARAHPDAICLGRPETDLAQSGAAEAAITRYNPQAVINAAAYTAVDRAEEEPELAHRVNGQATGEVAQACALRGIPLVHISTDYVFDGAGAHPFAPDHPTAPLGVYGQSKLAGEVATQAAGGVAVILRTSWVFSADGGNFLKTMLRLSGTHDHLRVVDDQIGGPTPAQDIAAACLHIAQRLQTDPTSAGIYHFSGAPDVSWAGFAREIFAQAGRDVTVEPIPTTDYPTPAARPLNSRLDCRALTARFGLERPDWRMALVPILRQMT